MIRLVPTPILVISGFGFVAQVGTIPEPLAWDAGGESGASTWAELGLRY